MELLKRLLGEKLDEILLLEIIDLSTGGRELYFTDEDYESLREKLLHAGYKLKTVRDNGNEFVFSDGSFDIAIRKIKRWGEKE